MTQLVVSLVVMFGLVAAAGQWAVVKQRRMAAQQAAEDAGHQNQEGARHGRDHR